MIDGKIINQFDNSIPKINTRAGDPPTMARQFAQGYLGLQTHGGTDRISYREIQVKDIAPADIPVNTVAPSVTGSGFQGNAADLQPRHVERRGRHDVLRQVVPLEQDRRRPTRASARRARPTTGNSDHPGRPALRHAEPDVDRLAAGRRGRHVHADGRGRRQGHPLRGQRRQRRRHGVEDRAGAGDPRRTNVTGAGGTVPATLSLTLGTPATFGAFTPGVTQTYDGVDHGQRDLDRR